MQCVTERKGYRSCQTIEGATSFPKVGFFSVEFDTLFYFELTTVINIGSCGSAFVLLTIVIPVVTYLLLLCCARLSYKITTSRFRLLNARASTHAIVVASVLAPVDRSILLHMPLCIDIPVVVLRGLSL